MDSSLSDMMIQLTASIVVIPALMSIAGLAKHLQAFAQKRDALHDTSAEQD